MDTSPPPQPPYGTLIELARKGAHLSIQAAADRARVSKATWIDSVRGYRKRGGRWEPVNPKPETIADMAGAVSISPDRLAAEGQRPDAAEVLREIIRQTEGQRLDTAGEMRREHPPARPSPPPPDGPIPAIPRSPDDTVQQMIRDVPGEWEKVAGLYEQVAERAALVIASLGGAVPPGGLIFSDPAEAWLIAEWDDLAGKRKRTVDGSPGKLWTADDVVTGIAVRLYQAGYGRQRDPGTASAGLARQSASAQLKRSPGERVRQDATRR